MRSRIYCESKLKMNPVLHSETCSVPDYNTNKINHIPVDRVRIQWFWIYCRKSFSKEAKHVCKKSLLWFKKHELVWGWTGQVSLVVCRRYRWYRFKLNLNTLSLKEIGNCLQILTIVLVNNTDVFISSLSIKNSVAIENWPLLALPTQGI